MVQPSLATLPPDLQFVPLANGAVARLEGAYPIVARLTSGDDGWSVHLLGASFDAQPVAVARGIRVYEAAQEAALIALLTAQVLEARDSYRFRRQEASPNRWYSDHTARQPTAWSGTLPHLERAGGVQYMDLDMELQSVLGYLDATFPHLVNLAQHRPHFDPARGRTTDPNEHTIEVLAGLNTRDLSDDDAYLAKVAIVYHDVGKGIDAYDPRHPLESARLAAPLLAYYGLTPAQQSTVLLQIREHDLLGILSRGRMTVAEAIERLHLRERPQNLALHAAIATADIGAIRGLRWVIAEGRIARAQQSVAEAAEIPSWERRAVP